MSAEKTNNPIIKEFKFLTKFHIELEGKYNMLIKENKKLLEENEELKEVIKLFYSEHAEKV